MACPEDVAANWGLAVEYAQSDGSIDTFSVQQADEDFEAGEISASEIQTVFEMAQSDCALGDAVDPTLSASASGSTVTARAGIDAPGGGVEATVEVSLGGATGQVTVTPSSDATVRFDVEPDPMEPSVEVCAEVVGVTPA